MCHTSRFPLRNSVQMPSVANPEPTSLRIMTRRRSTRSTTMPTIEENRMPGSVKDRILRANRVVEPVSR